MKNTDIRLKVALLSMCLVTASLNAITANIPEMAKSFSDMPLHMIELIATIPSLFAMFGILIGSSVAKAIGYKKTVLTGLLLCGIGGMLPVFLPYFWLILGTRCVFGLGSGLITSNLLTLIIYFFTGDTRSSMIGLQGSIGGLGSALAAFLAGKLLAFGWHMSFTVYAVAFISAGLVLLVVPEVKSVSSEKEKKNQTSQKGYGSLILLGLLDFVSVLLATFYVIKASTLITSAGYGSASEGSLAITLISIGSLLAGAMYGKMYSAMKEYALILFYGVCAAGFLSAVLISSLFGVYLGAFLLGWGYIAFVPFLQEKASRTFSAFGEKATGTILIFQSVGAFAAPYLGSLFSLVSDSLKTQFLFAAAGYLILMFIAWRMAAKA